MGAMKYLIVLFVIFTAGCTTHSPACCERLGIDISILIGNEGRECGGTWETNYWTYGAIKAKSKIESNNRKSLSCAKKFDALQIPFIYKYTFESFPDGGYSYYYILTKERKNVLLTYGSIGDEPFNFYLGYCENIKIENSGRLSFSENKCSNTAEEALFESVKIK